MLYDISMPVDARTAPWPGDEPYSCGWTLRKAAGASVNVGWAKSSAHVGTHVDAPYHFDDAGARVGSLPLDAFVGRCEVVDARGAAALDARLLRGVQAPRVLFRTRARNDPARFVGAFPLLTEDALAHLASMGARLVGIDAPSYDAADSKDLPIHHALAARGIVNVENLVLDDVERGAYELLAAPVRWIDMDAAPLRALLRS